MPDQSHTDAAPMSADNGPKRRSRRETGPSAVQVAVKALATVDKRTVAARRIAQFEERMVADLGGIDGLSEAQCALIRQAALVTCLVEALGAQWLQDGTVSDLWLPGIGVQRRILESLGLERVPKPPMSLNTYLAAKDAAKAKGETP